MILVYVKVNLVVIEWGLRVLYVVLIVLGGNKLSPRKFYVFNRRF